MIAAAFGLGAFSSSLFNDGDTAWHLATGQLILDSRSIPQTDPFSHTFPGQPWTAHEWLAELMMAGVFRLGGWAALAAGFALAFAVTLALLARELLRALPLRYGLLALALTGAVLAPFMLARPHVLAWLLLALWLLALLRARERRTVPPVAWAALMLIWANLHASYVFALGLLAAFALEALIEEADRRRVIFGWGRFGLLAAMFALVTPHGWQGLVYPLKVSGMEVLPLIEEWRPSRFPEDALFLVYAAAVAVLAFLGRSKLSLVRLALLVLLAAMAVLHARHQPLFVIVAALVISRGLSSRLDPRAAVPLRPVLILLAGLALLRVLLPLERSDSATYPATAIGRVPHAVRQQPVLNSYSFGGPLILHGIAPYIDGRADMYGDHFTAEHHRIILGDRKLFDRAVHRFGIRWTILQRGSPLIERLDRDPRWRRLHEDRWAVVHMRD